MLTHFNVEEFNCTHSNANLMDEAFLHKLDELRGKCGFPFKITSGYRDVTHPAEARKEKGGTHTQGIAADIAVSNGVDRMRIVKEALAMGFSGIGVSHSGGFVHVDMRTTTPVMWTYA
jgi:uncharacterized protein YcbK (DUF882 family)